MCTHRSPPARKSGSLRPAPLRDPVANQTVAKSPRPARCSPAASPLQRAAAHPQVAACGMLIVGPPNIGPIISPGPRPRTLRQRHDRHHLHRYRRLHPHLWLRLDQHRLRHAAIFRRRLHPIRTRRRETRRAAAQSTTSRRIDKATMGNIRTCGIIRRASIDSTQSIRLLCAVSAVSSLTHSGRTAIPGRAAD